MMQGRIYVCRKIGTGNGDIGDPRRPEIIQRLGNLPDCWWTAIDDPCPATDRMMVALWAPDTAHDLLHSEGYCYASARWEFNNPTAALADLATPEWLAALAAKGNTTAQGSTVGEALRDVARQFLTVQKHGANVPDHFTWGGAVL